MKNTYKQIVPLQRIYFDEVNHEVTVRYINGKYDCRVFTSDILNQEAVCKTKNLIGFTCRSMLRMEDKCGNISEFADSARFRTNKKTIKGRTS